MVFTSTAHGYIIRIGAGEKLHDSLQTFAEERSVQGGFFLGLGAVRWARIGMYHMSDHAYRFQEFDAPHEITNLTGNIALKDNELMIHAHITLADSTQQAVGGHLDEAVVEPTCEIQLTTLDTPLARTYDEYSRLPLLDLPDSIHN